MITGSQIIVKCLESEGVRVVFGYNQETKTDTVSFDVLYGIKELDTNMIVKLVG